MTPTPLAGRVALVTGGSRGLGRVMAEALAEAGARVIATARSDAEGLAALAAEWPGMIEGTLSDAGDADACAALVGDIQRRYGRLDIVIANAGLGMIHVKPDYRTAPVRFWECGATDWQRLLATNVIGPAALVAASVPAMLAAGWGRIITIGTGHGTMVRAHYAPYGPAKAALEAATVIWAKELAGTGVTANCLVPGGATDTSFMPAALRQSPASGLLDPAIMAAPAVWLASDESGDCNGRRIVARRWGQGRDAAIADGGWGPGGQPPGSDAST